MSCKDNADSGRGWSRILEAKEQLGRGVGGGRLHEDGQGAGPLQSGHIHLPPFVQFRLTEMFRLLFPIPIKYFIVRYVA